MDPTRRDIAAAVLERAERHDAEQADRLDRFRSLEVESASLLWLLVRASGAQRILELGTSIGHSAIWLADAAAATRGRLTSVDCDAARIGLAAANLERAGLTADLLQRDAGEVLRESGDCSWDFVLLDCERSAYADYWPDLFRTLRTDGGVLAIDNVLSHPEEVAPLIALIEAEPEVVTATVATGAGLQLVVRGGEGRAGQ